MSVPALPATLPVVGRIQGRDFSYLDSRHRAVDPGDFQQARTILRDVIKGVIAEDGRTDTYLCGADPTYRAWRDEAWAQVHEQTPDTTHAAWVEAGGEVRDDSDTDRRLAVLHFIAYGGGEVRGLITFYNGLATAIEPGLYVVEAMVVPGVPVDLDADLWATWSQIFEDFLSQDHLLLEEDPSVRLDAIRFPERPGHAWDTDDCHRMIDALATDGRTLSMHPDGTPARLARS